MSRKNATDPAALLETAPTTAPDPAPPVEYSNAAKALFVMHDDVVKLGKDIKDLEAFLEDRNAEFDDRSMECDLTDQKQCAGLTILSTQCSAGTLRLTRFKEMHEAKLGVLRNLNKAVHQEILAASEQRAHYKLKHLEREGRSRDSIINGRKGDDIRGEISRIRMVAPSGSNPLHEAGVLVPLAKEVAEELNELKHEHGPLTVAWETDWLQNRAPEQTRGRR